MENSNDPSSTSMSHNDYLSFLSTMNNKLVATPYAVDSPKPKKTVPSVFKHTNLKSELANEPKVAYNISQDTSFFVLEQRSVFSYIRCLEREYDQ